MNSTEQKFTVAVILEMIGRPKEHIVASLKDMVKQIGEEKGIEIKEEKINEPAELKDKKDFYTSFAEIELEINGMEELIILMFKYMPSHLDIISPEKVSVSNNTLNEILNEMSRRLHGYDEVARVLQLEKSILEKKLKDLMDKKND